MSESFLTKAMGKINATNNDNVITPQKKEEAKKLEPAKKETTVIPSDKQKIQYKQQTLSMIAGGMNNGQQE